MPKRDNQREVMMTFGGHLGVLSRLLLRIAAIVTAAATMIFCLKDRIFTCVFAPSSSDFIFFRALRHLLYTFHLDSSFDDFHLELINTDLSSQFMTHISMSFYFGLLVASPYIVFELFRFVSPALYANERKMSMLLTVGSYVLFAIGLLVCYFIVFPISLRFLGTYQVSNIVKNTITLSSYMSTFINLSLAMGLIFEVPILAFFTAKLGFVTSSMLISHWRIAIVIIAVISAIITPPDLFSCIIVMIPICALYEASILIVKHVERHGSKEFIGNLP